MLRLGGFASLLLASSILFGLDDGAVAQRPAKTSAGDDNSNFGPVMRAYLGYLRNEQEVVDDRISRREITPTYYHRNSNRIRALRQMAIRLARSGNDYVPELEAVTTDEFGTLFEKPPRPASFHTNEIVMKKFRFLGVEHTGEIFYLFARLDPYEQAALIEGQNGDSIPAPGSEGTGPGVAKGQRVGQTTARPRRVIPK
jgi:hypothetical protein